MLRERERVLLDRLDENIQHSEVISRLASVGEIAAGVAHEIRNPLTSVRGLLQLLRERHDYEHWDIVFSEIDQAITAVQNLLSVSKPTLESEPISDLSLCVEVENILSLFQQNTYRIEFRKHWNDKVTKIRGKRNQIKQALFNLVKNACEAIETTGTITIEHYRKDDHVVLTITDDGVGIPPDIIGRLGTPFLTTKPDGTGMGLAQVYSALRENQATIEVSSVQGEGTTFKLTFPVSPLYSESHGGVPKVSGVKLDLADNIRDFFRINQKRFNELLEQHARTTFQIVSESKFVTREDLLNHAYQITELVLDGLTQNIVEFAQERGVAWAKSDIPIISKLEWFYALRKVVWYFLEQFYSGKDLDATRVFEIAGNASEALDTFIVHFNVSFTKYREDVLHAQQAIIEELSVPVIPLFDGIGVLPIVGTLDNRRLETIDSRLLEEIEKQNMRKLFIDMSAAVITDNIDMNLLDRILMGVTLLGAEAVLTGVSARLARYLLNSDKDLVKRIPVESTLRKALQRAIEEGVKAGVQAL